MITSYILSSTRVTQDRQALTANKDDQDYRELWGHRENPVFRAYRHPRGIGVTPDLRDSLGPKEALATEARRDLLVIPALQE